MHAPVYCPIKHDEGGKRQSFCLWYTLYKGVTTANFSKELVSAARSYLGRPAVYHQNFAGNCLEQPAYASTRCFDDGLGPNSFDCTGLVLRAISDVLGTADDPLIYRRDARHVRDIWNQAQAQTPTGAGDGGAFAPCELSIGALIVPRRFYDIGNKHVEVPGHIGIITEVSGKMPVFIHAQAGEGLGKVEERPLRRLDTLLGYVAYNEPARSGRVFMAETLR